MNTLEGEASRTERSLVGVTLGVLQLDSSNQERGGSSYDSRGVVNCENEKKTPNCSGSLLRCTRNATCRSPIVSRDKSVVT